MDVSPFFLLIVLHFNSHSFELCPGPDGDSVCCFGYVWSLKQRKCIPLNTVTMCMDVESYQAAQKKYMYN
ncbi:uncharacterized protein LOC111102948 isoform X2 [Crassostrea virginica]